MLGEGGMRERGAWMKERGAWMKERKLRVGRGDFEYFIFIVFYYILFLYDDLSLSPIE
jgi:hypothetical protein